MKAYLVALFAILSVVLLTSCAGSRTTEQQNRYNQQQQLKPYNTNTPEHVAATMISGS